MKAKERGNMETKKWEKQQYLDVLQDKNGKHITSSGYISKLTQKIY